MAGSFASAHATIEAPAHFRDVVVVGGGCYGSFYAGQLEKARSRGLASWRRLIIVDLDPNCAAAGNGTPGGRELVVREWGLFFDEWLAAEAGTGDAIVPSPLMPHLMYEWLVRRARARWPGREIVMAPVGTSAGTPYDMLAPDGRRYVSFADWLCPTHCVEPAICPVTRAPRTWEMGDAAADTVRRMRRTHPAADAVLFTCRHRVFGVGMFDAAAVLGGDAAVAEAGATGAAIDVLVGTVSACHGAFGLLRLGAG